MVKSPYKLDANRHYKRDLKVTNSQHMNEHRVIFTIIIVQNVDDLQRTFCCSINCFDNWFYVSWWQLSSWQTGWRLSRSVNCWLFIG